MATSSAVSRCQTGGLAGPLREREGKQRGSRSTVTMRRGGRCESAGEQQLGGRRRQGGQHSRDGDRVNGAAGQGRESVLSAFRATQNQARVEASEVAASNARHLYIDTKEDDASDIDLLGSGETWQDGSNTAQKQPVGKERHSLHLLLESLHSLNTELPRSSDAQPGTSPSDHSSPGTSSFVHHTAPHSPLLPSLENSWDPLQRSALQTTHERGQADPQLFSPSAPSYPHSDVVTEDHDPPPFRLHLSCAQSTLLLNFLAFGYAATAVMVKAMAGGEGAALSSLDQAHLPAVAAAGGWLSLSTALDFTVRFSSAAAVSAALLWLTGRKSSPAEVPHDSAPPPSPGKHRDQSSTLPVLAGMDRGAWGAGIELGLWMFLTYAGQAVGMQTTAAHEAALILTAAVVLVPFMEALAGSKLHWSVWGATLFACSGLVLLEGGAPAAAQAASEAAGAVGSLMPPLEFPAHSLVPSPPSGHFWCFLGAVASAIHVVRSEHQCSQHSALQLVTLQLGTTAVLSLLWLSLALSHSLSLSPSTDCSLFSCLHSAWATVPLGMVLLSGPIGTGLCEWLELEALQYVKASTATLVLTSSPLWASLLAFLTLGETMTLSSMAGAGLILTASLQVQLLCPCKGYSA